MVDKFSGSTEWPNRDGHFDLLEFRLESYLKVEGRKRGTLASPVLGLQSPSYPSTSGSTAGYSSMFRFVVLFNLIQYNSIFGLFPQKKNSIYYCRTVCGIFCMPILQSLKLILA